MWMRPYSNHVTQNYGDASAFTLIAAHVPWPFGAHSHTSTSPYRSLHKRVKSQKIATVRSTIHNNRASPPLLRIPLKWFIPNSFQLLLHHILDRIDKSGGVCLQILQSHDTAQRLYNGYNLLGHAPFIETLCVRHNEGYKSTERTGKYSYRADKLETAIHHKPFRANELHIFITLEICSLATRYMANERSLNGNG